MRRIIVHAIVVGAASLALAVAARAQDSTVSQAGAAKPSKAARVFRDEAPLAVTFTINVKRIRGDRGESPPWRAATLSLADEDGKPVTVPVRARTRGIWRLHNCDFPPIRLNFKGDDTKHTVLRGLDKPKLVNYCRDTDMYERYILEELQLYRAYNLITPVSHRVRLLRMVYVDSASGKTKATRYAILEEEPQALAERVGGQLLEQKGAMPGDLGAYQDALFGVFQFMIGNTDFAVSALHNVELISLPNMSVSPVAYDFDYAGAISTTYAIPSEKLPIRSVRERIFRGYCEPDSAFERAFARFREQKDAIYALYHDDVGNLLPRRTVDETLKYFDDFYEIIDDAHAARRQILEACLGRR